MWNTKKPLKKLDVSAKNDLFPSFAAFNSFEMERKRHNSHNDRLSHNVCAINGSTLRKNLKKNIHETMCKLVLSIVNQPNTPSESVNLYLWLAAVSLRKYAKSINYQLDRAHSVFSALYVCEHATGGNAFHHFAKSSASKFMTTGRTV